MITDIIDRATSTQAPHKKYSVGRTLRSFSQELYRVGYVKGTVIAHLRSATHFIRWAKRRRARLSNLNDAWIDRFAHHLKHCSCARGHSKDHVWRVNTVCGARHFLTHLQEVGIVVAAPKAAPHEPALLAAFKQWMQRQRGTCDVTLGSYSPHILALLRQLGDDPKKFDVPSLREFVLKESLHRGWATAQTCATALRAFLRFLIAEGQCPASLEAAVPVLAHWRRSRMPRYFQPEVVEQLIATCDPDTSLGKRDRAVLLLLARLALRAGDIMQCRLSDVDWKGGWIHVRGKSRRSTSLPLTQEVGQAIVTYLQEARPRSTSDHLFVCCHAPFRPFGTPALVSMIVDRAIRRAGVKRPARGAAHLLRHSVASNLLQQGSSLQDIAALLRHRSIQTTRIYAKVDVTALRLVIQPWPQVQSC
jgi:integrase/recombinase XerD